MLFRIITFSIAVLFSVILPAHATVYEYTFNEKVFSKNGETASLSGINWTLQEKSNKRLEFTYSSTNGIGIRCFDNHPMQPLTLSTDEIKGNISSVTIQTSAGNSTHISVSVHDIKYSCNGYNSPIIATSSKEYKFTGDAKGKISITWTQPDRTYVYIKRISIEYNNGETQQTQTLSFPENSYTVTPHTSFKAPALEGAKTSVTYSSSQPEVATVNANTGAVSIVGLGTTVIKATAEENDEYFAATAEYTLHVKWPNNQAVFDLRHPEYFGIPIPGSGNESPVEKTLLAGDIRLLNGGTGVYRMRFWNTGSACELRTYKNNNITFEAPAGLTIERIELTGNQIVGLEHNGEKIENGIWTGRQSSVTFQVTETVYISKITVTFSGEYQLNVSAAGYATFSAARSYRMPESLQGAIVSVEGSTAHARFLYPAGSIVPAGEALLIKGEAGSYPLSSANDDTIQPHEDNLLHGVLVNDTLTAPDGSEWFIFAKNANGELGFYYQKDSQNGQQVGNLANKAYLEVPADIAPQGFSLQLDIVDGIEEQPVNVPSHRPIIYTLTGTRVELPVSRLPQGVYIVDGKKKLIP